MKRWLTQRFLPLWAKETVLRDNKALQAENVRLQGRIRELESYIRGLHKGMSKAKCTMQNDIRDKFRFVEQFARMHNS